MRNFFCKIAYRTKKLKKGLINIKNNDQKCFSLCHISHINPVKIRPEIITRKGEELANDRAYDGVKFSVQEKDFSKIETKNNICINTYCYGKKLTFPIYISDQKFEKFNGFIACN